VEKINHPIFLIVICCCFSGCGSSSSTSEKPISAKIDKANAFTLVKEIVAIGPRPSNSENAGKTASLIIEKSRKFGYDATLDEWTEMTADGNKTFRNVYAELKGRKKGFVVLGSHFDTKILPGVSNFMGANDSGSSTGLVLEIMRVLGELSKWDGPGIRFAFFDGEESVKSYSQCDIDLALALNDW